MLTREPQSGTVDRERLFQRLIETLTDFAIYMLDEHGRIVTWNSGAERLTGYSAAAMMGQLFLRLLVPGDERGKAIATAIEAARRDGRCEVEGWHLRKDGSRFWASLVIEAVREQGRLIGFANVTRDITRRHAEETALRESERRFRLLVQGVVDYAIYMLDPSGLVVNWNAGAERIKGYRQDEIVGRHFSCFYSNEDRAAGLPARNLEAARTHGRYEAEGWRIRKDGSRLWALVVIDAIHDETGELIGFAKITRDMTERRMAQEALRESERQFRLLVAGVTDYALYMLDPNGNVVSWNTGAEKIKGYAADEIIGQHFSRFFTEADRRAGVPARILQTAERDGRFESEGIRLRKDGSTFWASAIVDAIRDEHGQLVGFAKITRDITERREAQARLEKMNQQLAHAQKMEAMGQLTGGVAHDFNNLLMIVGGHARIVKKRLRDDDKAIASIAAIESAAQRGATLTRQLLTFARSQRLNPEIVDLGDTVETFRAMLGSATPGDIALAVDIPQETWPVEVDVSEFELALVNLAVNARDAMPTGGRITISAENATLTPGDLDAGLDGDFVALTIADTGAGIPDDVLPRIFDPFFTTKAVGKGSGLGLAQVYGFVHQSGGTVTVATAIGAGTRFTLYLPRGRSVRIESPQPEQSEGYDGTGLTVLLVEDNPDVAEVTVALLGDLGYSVLRADSAEAALTVLDQHDNVQLVLSDIVMPGTMSGMTLAREIRRTRPQLPVLLATGYSKAASDASDEFPILRKPYEAADLQRAITRIVAAAHRPDGDNLVPFPKPRRT